jgi:hypothetical protein
MHGYIPLLLVHLENHDLSNNEMYKDTEVINSEVEEYRRITQFARGSQQHT